MGIIAGLVAFGLAFATRTHGTARAPVRSPTGLETRIASFELHPAAARLSVRSRDGALSRELDLALVVDGTTRPLVLDRDEIVILLRLEPRVVVRDPRGDDPHHFARDEPFDRGRIGHLLADGDLEPLLEQSLEVGAGGVVRHARHRDLVVRPFVAGGQRQIESPRRHHGVLEEKLVEVPHAKEKQRVRVRRLRRQVLPHHRRLRGFRHRLPGISSTGCERTGAC